MPDHFVVVVERRLLKEDGDEVVQDWRCGMSMVQRFDSYAEADLKRTHREQSAAVEKPIYLPHGCREERRFWVGTIVPAEASEGDPEPTGHRSTLGHCDGCNSGAMWCFECDVRCCGCTRCKCETHSEAESGV